MQAGCIDASGIGPPFLDIHQWEAIVANPLDKMCYGDDGPGNNLGNNLYKCFSKHPKTPNNRDSMVSTLLAMNDSRSVEYINAKSRNAGVTKKYLCKPLQGQAVRASLDGMFPKRSECS